MQDDQPKDWPQEPPAPTKVGDFECRSLLGTGGMGEVWLAWQESVGRAVALKLLPTHMSDNPRAVLRFRREAAAGGRLTHPHIATVYAAGIANGRLFIAQELVSGGRSLADWIRELPQGQPLGAAHFAQVASVVAQIARALQYAHDQGVIHRDIKPQNVLFTPDGTPKLVDFGLAMIHDGFTVSQSGEVAGTYAYMSPEQVRARSSEVDHRTDVFSLGATLYELLTLQRPFCGDSIHEMAEHILHTTPKPPHQLRPEVPPHLQSACLRALEKNKDDRFQSMKAFADTLSAFQDHALTPGKFQVGHGRATRRNLWIGALVTGLALTAALGVKVLHKAPPMDTVDRHGIPGNPFTKLSYYPQLSAFARKQISRYEQDMTKAQREDSTTDAVHECSVSSLSILAGSTLTMAVDHIKASLPLPITIAHPVENATLISDIDLQFPSTVATALDLIVDHASDDVGWMTSGNCIVIDTRSAVQGPIFRAYAVCDLIRVPSHARGLDFTYDTAKKEGEDFLEPSDLAVLLQETVAVGSWTEEGVSIDVWEDTIAINHRPDVHLKVQAFFAAIRSCYLLDECDNDLWAQVNAQPHRVATDRSIRRTLSQHILTKSFVGVAPENILPLLENELGRDIEIHLPEEGKDLKSWIFGTHSRDDSSGPLTFGEAMNVRWTVVGAIVHLGWGDATHDYLARAYPVWDLVLLDDSYGDSAPEGWPLLPYDSLEQLIRNNVNPGAWASNPYFSLKVREGLMIVHADDVTHNAITVVLGELRDQR